MLYVYDYVGLDNFTFFYVYRFVELQLQRSIT